MTVDSDAVDDLEICDEFITEGTPLRPENTSRDAGGDANGIIGAYSPTSALH